MDAPTTATQVIFVLCVAGCATWVVLCLLNLNDKFRGMLPYLRRYDRLKRRMKCQPPPGPQLICKHRLYGTQCPVCILHRKVEAAKLQKELDLLQATEGEDLPLAEELP